MASTEREAYRWTCLNQQPVLLSYQPPGDSEVHRGLTIAAHACGWIRSFSRATHVTLDRYFTVITWLMSPLPVERLSDVSDGYVLGAAKGASCSNELCPAPCVRSHRVLNASVFQNFLDAAPPHSPQSPFSFLFRPWLCHRLRYVSIKPPRQGSHPFH